MTMQMDRVEQQSLPAKVETVLIQGDLSKLGPEERVTYYNAVCQSLGLNPLTKPFEYITLNGKLTLYARRDCTDQLRAIHKVSLVISERRLEGDIYTVTARATTPAGRCEESTGAVSVAGLKGEGLANAYMKAETKAKRRVTLSLIGLGLLDETEAETVASDQPIRYDRETGEILEDDTSYAPVQRPALGPPRNPEPHPGIVANQQEEQRRERLRGKWQRCRDHALQVGIDIGEFPEEKTNDQINAFLDASDKIVRPKIEEQAALARAAQQQGPPPETNEGDPFQ